MHGAAKFDEIEEIHIRVGGLPQDPQPPLELSARILGRRFDQRVHRGRPRDTRRQGHRSRVDDRDRELSSSTASRRSKRFRHRAEHRHLPDTFLGKIRDLDYKTIRYAGHCEKFKTMIDLGSVFERRDGRSKYGRSRREESSRTSAEALACRWSGLRSGAFGFRRKERWRDEATALRHRRQAGRADRACRR